jgi:NADH:ubiquinone oxidoreductase subunit F (NADH-binding)
LKIFKSEIVFGFENHELSLGGTRVNFAQHSSAHAPGNELSETDKDNFLELLESSGLTGHGGAHFPVARKLKAAMQSPPGGIVVANAAEGEPGSAKDAALWQYVPHTLIDGMELVAQLISAKRLVIWVHEDERATHRSISDALEERAEAGQAIKIEVLNMPARYTSGENTSVISGVKGNKIAPRFGLDKAQPWGVGQPAILAHNSETLARIAMVKRFGAKAAQQHLLTVVGQDRRSVREVSSSTTYEEAMPEVSGNPAVLFGGYGATWMPWESVKHLHCDPSLLRAAGLSFGAGIIGALPKEACPIVETGRVLTWMAAQSARQCGPCFQGLADVAQRWNSMALGTINQDEYSVLLRHIGLIPGRGGCSHPDGVIRLARSAINLFAQEVDGHLKGLCSSKKAINFLPIPLEKVSQ